MRRHRKDEGRLAGKPQCPTCGTLIDGFTGVANRAAAPRDGDVSFCGYCGQALEARGEQWVKLQGAALEEAMRNPRVRIARAVVAMYRNRHQS